MCENVTHLGSMECSTLALEVHTVLQATDENVSMREQCLTMPMQDLDRQGKGIRLWSFQKHNSLCIAGTFCPSSTFTYYTMGYCTIRSSTAKLAKKANHISRSLQLMVASNYICSMPWIKKGLTCDRSWMFHIRSLSGCSDSLWSGSKWMVIMDRVIGSNGQGYWCRVIGGNGRGYWW